MKPETLILSANKGAADDWARTQFPDGALGLHRMTLPQLASALAARPLAQRGVTLLNRLGMEALTARITHHVLHQHGLAYFHPVAAMPGFPRALANTLTELRMAEIRPAQLEPAGAAGPDLALLLAAFEDALAEQNLADTAAIFQTAAGVREHPLLGLPVILIDVPIVSALELRLLQSICEQAPDARASVLAADETTFHACHEIPNLRIDLLGGRGFEKFLFSPAAPPQQDRRVLFFSAATEGLECVEIARRLQALAGQGVPFDQTAILLRSPDRYQPLVEEALRRAGIPAYFSRGSIRPEPAGRAFLALLACAAEGVPASRFAEYLSLGQAPAIERAMTAGWIPTDFEAEPPPLDTEPPRFPEPAQWERLLVDAAVIGGRDRWERRLRGLEAEFRLRLESLEEQQDSLRQHLQRQLDWLRGLQRFALPLIERLHDLPKQATWGEWLERLTALAEHSLRWPDPVLSVLNELWPMQEIGPAGLNEVRLVLEERLGQLRREPPARRYGRVFVGTPDEARGRSFSTVFLPGLAEGLFPRRALEDPLLLDAARRQISPHLLRRSGKVAKERLLLHSAAAAALNQFVISYPRMDSEQARPRVPSFYALEVLRAAEGQLPELKAFETRAAQATTTRLGWPSPRDPSHAIDDTEFDLAVLDSATSLPPAEAKGAANYLLQRNAHAARSLRNRARRWRPSWFPADGLVDPSPETLRALAKHRLRERVYSPSSLEQFAACPYRFLLQGIHQLRPREEAVAIERMDPLTRGSLFHAVQFAWFRALSAKGLIPVHPLRLDAALELGDRILDETAARFEEDLAPAIPSVWKNEIEDLRLDLRSWIRRSAPLQSQWQPRHFELAFGLAHGADSAHDPASTTREVEIAQGVRLRGSIDLVESNPDGRTLRVTDHKTGRKPQRIPGYLGGGSALQPLLYALAAQCLLDLPVTAGRLYYCTERGGYTEVEIAVSDGALRFLARAAEIIDAAIAKGFLPAAPQSGACDHCDYRAVCGPYEQIRIARKKQDALTEIGELRSMP